MKKRKKIFVTILFSTCIAILLGSCHELQEDDSGHQKADQKIIEQAKIWYEANVPETIMLRSSEDSHQMQTNPDWKSAFVESNENYQVVETPILSKEKLYTVSKECYDLYKTTQNEAFRASLMRMVFLTNKKDQKTIGFLMTITPDAGWISESDFNPCENTTYLKRNKDFSGLIIYHHLNGEYANGWRYTDGKVTGTVSPISTRSSNEPSLRGGCMTVDYYLIWEECTELLNHNGEVIGWARCHEVLTHAYEYEVCDGDNGTGDYSGGGSSGGEDKDAEKRTDCPPAAAQHSTYAISVLNNTSTANNGQVKSNVDILRDYAKNKSTEYGFSISFIEGQYFIPRTNDAYIIGSPHLSSIVIETADETIFIVHTHPLGTNPAPSPADAILVANEYKDEHTNFQGNINIAGDGSEYIVYINDPTALGIFCNNPNNNGFFEQNGGLFKPGSIWDNEYNSVHSNLINQGYSQNNAQSYALSYVLSKFNTGLTILYRKNKDEDFKEQNTIKNDSNNSTNYKPQICQ